MVLIKEIHSDIYPSSSIGLDNGLIVIGNSVLTDQWRVKYKFEKIERLKDGRFLVQDKKDVKLFSKDFEKVALTKIGRAHV